MLRHRVPCLPVSDADKQKQVAKIVWEQKIMEKESERTIAEIEGGICILVVHSVLYVVCQVFVGFLFYIHTLPFL